MGLSDIGVAGALAVFFSGLGAALDHLVLPHQSEKLKTVLIRWWDYVDNIRFRDIAHEMVDLYVKKERRIFGKFLSLRWLITAFVISLMVTTFAIVAGRSLGLFLTINCGNGMDQFGGPWGTAKTALRAAVGYFESNVDKTRIYLINMTFDGLTLAATLMFLRAYLAIRRFIGRYILVLFDICACIIFFYVCVYLSFYTDKTTSGLEYNLLNFYKMFYSLGPFSCTHYHIFTSTLVFSSTIFLPTLIYLSSILFTMTAKFSLESAKWITQHTLELGATQQKTIFFYSGILLGIFASLSKLILDISKIVLS